ncbi:MAG: hypothetical protein V1842_04365 [Candidatus Omnitrophota bacterium]|nr:hypothetical protein [Candidatus Omnitrophota bacterium]MBU1929301.1 hypothetical protein [Candidatus Omnitrophota bacterium]
MFFYSPACNHCASARQNLIPRIEERFKGRIEIDYRDITNIENYKMLISLQEKYSKSGNIILPVFFFEGNIVSGEKDVNENLIRVIDNSLNASPKKENHSFSIDLKERFLSFTPLAVTGAGLVDGINPCAFTVVVFFISFLALQGYRKLDMAITGVFFIITVFLTYLLIGLGIFDGLYRISGFWIVARVINYCLGILSLILGVFCVYDLIRLVKTGDSQGMILQLPKSVKERIHSLIRLHYHNPRRAEGVKPKLRIFQLIFTAVTIGFLVSLLEAVCTGQLYLPTIAFILKASEFKIRAVFFLLLYNVMFIIPLLAVFLLAMFGLTSVNFSQFMRKYIVWIKFIMAVVFFSLGWLLVWRL